MQYKQVDRDYFLYIEKNEKIMETVTKFCTNTEIGAFDTVTKKYVKKQFNNVLELVSFEGNVTLKDGSAFAHAHVVLSDHEMRTLGGHLFETTVAAVGELFIRKFEGDAYRKMNDDIGLPCICLENNF